MRTTLLFFFTLTISTLLAQPAAKNQDAFLVKPYLQYSTKNSMSIMWETKVPASSTVLFGEAMLDVNETPLPQETSLEGTRIMHEVRLEGLKPATNYFWRVRSYTENGEEILSEVYSFRTVIKDEDAYLFALVGDSQKNDGTPWAWGKIAERVWQERPNFIVHAGDLVDWGPTKTDWTEHFFPGGQALMARIPMYTVLGNHEGDADLYYQYMANPKPEWRYTFRYGNAEFFMIDTNKDVSEGSDQYNWLEQALAQSTATWKIAIHHHPPYSSEKDDHGDTYKEASRLGTHARDLTPLYDKYGVDFCLFGHTHVYERSWPLKENRISQKEGTIYINSGGAGGFLETFAPTRSWFTAEIKETHHFCTFGIYGRTLFFKAIDDQGRVFDSFQMEKDPSRNELTVIEPPAPIIESETFVFHESTQVNILPGLDGLEVRYTLDGSEPSRKSKKYTGPISIDASVELRARTYTKDGHASRVVRKDFRQMAPLPAQQTSETERGLVYQLFTGDWRGQEASYFSAQEPVQIGTLSMLNLDDIQPASDYWGIQIEGYLEVPETKAYHFYALASRGLELVIDDQVSIQTHREDLSLQSVVLEKGKHKIAIKSYQWNWRKAFSVGFHDPVLGRRPFAAFNLSH